MALYQHVLLAIDYSPQSIFVAKKAQQIAEQNAAKFSIVYVIEFLKKQAKYHVDDMLDQEVVDMLDQEQMNLQEVAEDLGISKENQWLRAGMPAREIVELAQEQEVDLIVIGAHHHAGFKRLFDSASIKALKRSTCDLLAVHLT